MAFFPRRDTVEVEKDVEKTAAKEVCQKKTDTKEKNGDCVVAAEKAENDEDKTEEESDKLKSNGHSKENGVAAKEETDSKDATGTTTITRVYYIVVDYFSVRLLFSREYFSRNFR